MKKAKLLAVLTCLVLGFSVSASACNFLNSDSASESPATSNSEPASESQGSSEEENSTPNSSTTDSSTTTDSSSSSEEDVTPATYSVTFVADGETVETCYYTEEVPEIIEPTVPAKEGYTAAWEAYELTSGNITVNAVYTAIEYTITFVGYEGVEPITFTVETKDEVVFPELTQEEGFDIYWDKTEADITLSDMTVNYVKEIKKYTVTFVGVEGIEPIEYTADELETVVFPEAPEAAGYIVSWDKSEEDLTLADLTVNYVKEAIVYTIDFVGAEIEPIEFTVETLDELVIPEAPAVDGYITGWDKSIDDVTLSDITFTYFKMTEKEYYSRDIKGDAMASLIQPIWEGNSVEWVEEEGAYHLINVCPDEDDKRGFQLDQEYLANIIRIGGKTLSFSIKVDNPEAGATIYRGFYPNWWGTPNVDFWQISGATDYVNVIIDLRNVPTTDDGALKSIFLLADKSGMYIKDIEIWAPDFNNLTTRDIEKAFTPNYATSYVAWDETEGAWLFKNNATSDDNSRAFLMDQELYNAMKSIAASISFKVKFVGEKFVEGKDSTLYVSFASRSVNNWDNWWGVHQAVGYVAEGYKEVNVSFHEDADRSLFFLCASGSFYVKDVQLIPKTSTMVHDYVLDGVNNGPTDVKASGLGAFVASNYQVVSGEGAPEGVDGTAVKLSNINQYQAGAVVFNDGFDGTITENTMINIRLYVEDTGDNASMQLWMYHADYDGHGGEGALDQITINANGWVTISVKAAPYLTDGVLTGFQFGFFALADGTQLEGFYVDSITLVTAEPISVIK